MKKTINIIVLASLLIVGGCKDNELLYDDRQDRLNFVYTSDLGPLASGAGDIYPDAPDAAAYTFAYNDLESYDFPMLVMTSGFVRSFDRTVEFRQIPAGEGLEDAVPGVHYVALDDPAYAGRMVIKAGMAQAELPIILLRDESLKTKVISLRLQIVENDHFKWGFDFRSEKLIDFSAQLVRPDNWRDQDFGIYGPVKHQFMIDVTGEPVDFDYFTRMGFDATGNRALGADAIYITYMKDWFRSELKKENERLETLPPPEGPGPLKEKDGTLVSFP